MSWPDDTASVNRGHRKRGTLPKAAVRPGSRIPGWMPSLGTFFVVAGGGTVLLARVVVPAVIAHAQAGNLRGTAELLTWLFLGVTGLAGALAGLAGSWQAGRAGQASRITRVFQAMLGPALVIGALTATAYLTHRPIPSRATEANAAVALACAFAVGLAVSIMHEASPLAQPPHPAPPPGGSRFAVFALAAAAAASTWPTAPADRPPVRPALAVIVGNLADPLRGGGDITNADCVISAMVTDASAKFTVFSLDLGAGFHYGLTTHPGGSVDVEVAVGLRAGLTFSWGMGSSGILGKLGTALGTKVSLSTDATVTEVSTFAASNAAQGNDIIKWALGRYSLTELALPGLGSWVTSIYGPVNAATERREPTKTALQFAGNLEATVEAGFEIASKFTLSLGTETEIVLANDNNTDPAIVRDPTSVTIATSVTAAGGAEATAVIGGGLSGDLSGGATASLTFTKTHGIWLPSEAGIGVNVALSGAASFAAAAHDLGNGGGAEDASDAASKAQEGSQRRPKAKGGIKAGASQGVTLEVSDTSNDPRVVADFLSLLSIALDPGTANKAPPPSRRLDDALRTFAADLAAHGRLVGQFYNVTTDDLGVEASVGDALTFGGSVSAGTTIKNLSVAVVRPAGGPLRISRTCPGPAPKKRPASGLTTTAMPATSRYSVNSSSRPHQDV